MRKWADFYLASSAQANRSLSEEPFKLDLKLIKIENGH